jgi:AraC-like DNA-binding protein
MPLLTISESAYNDLWEETNPTPQAIDPTDPLDTLLRVPKDFGQGFRRQIEWPEGVSLEIDDYRWHRNLAMEQREHPHPIQMGFLLLGCYRSKKTEEVSSGTNWFCGSGLAAGGLHEEFARQQIARVDIHIAPEIYASAITDSRGKIPDDLAHLLKDLSQTYFYRYGAVTPEMQLALRQLWRCPYQGATKRMYLESKIWELLALMTAQEQSRTVAPPLELDDVDRLHQAKEILRQRLDNPPSLLELARLVGLNDNALKRGFRQVFGTTVFGYLHDYRLEQAQQLLASGDMNVTEVAAAIGFESRSYFSIAFRKKFGINPKDYQMQCKKSG